MGTFRGNRTVLVIGAGVSGLTCALCLRRRGHNVRVVADNFAPRITSVVAGALWEWPPAVCGYHHDQISLSRSKVWCMTSFEHFSHLASEERTGVFMRTVNFYFRRPLEDTREQLLKMREIQANVPEFVRDRAKIQSIGVNPALGLCDTYSHLAPMVDTDVYMAYLLDRVKEEGCSVCSEKITGELRKQEERLRRHFGVDVIVNCSGLGAMELAAEYMYPLRGALIRVHNDGVSMPRVTEAHCVSHDESDIQDIVFIVPRGKNMLILGGLAESEEWDLNISLENYEPIRQMYKRCVEFMPVLKHARFDAAEPVRVGLRPFRKQNVRLDHVTGTRIIHNYGHGGAGVTLSWGCALEVVDLVQGLFQ